MADGTIYKFNYIGLLGLIQYYLGDWRSFEGWCTSKQVNPLKENPRRLISLMFFFIEMDMDDKGREEFRHSVENPSIKIPKPTQVTETKKIVPLDPNRKWRAPEGWTPPGWNEDRSYAAAKSFMGFQANPK